MDDTNTTPQHSAWQIAEGRMGLPQKFRIDDRVQFRDGVFHRYLGILRIVGTVKDTKNPGRIAYLVRIPNKPRREPIPVAEDILEAVTNV
jgi:hypothetical protein